MRQMQPQEAEGVTKFELVFRLAAPLPPARLSRLIAWRDVLHGNGLIGLDLRRYGGVGFGNVSQRLTARVRTSALRFAVSGTQTSGLPNVGARHFAIVTAADVMRNCIVAEGPVSPSSESLTHAMLYRLDPTIGYVFHVHCPSIWSNAKRLQIPGTRRDVAYGTPAMALEMQRLWAQGVVRRRRLLVMGGHEDGVLAFGHTAGDAGTVLFDAYASSRC